MLRFCLPSSARTKSEEDMEERVKGTRAFLHHQRCIQMGKDLEQTTGHFSDLGLIRTAIRLLWSVWDAR